MAECPAGSSSPLSSPSKRYRCDPEPASSQLSSPSSQEEKTRSNLSNSKQVLQNASQYLNTCFDDVKIHVLDMLQARHNEMIKLAVTERDKILSDIEDSREKLKQEKEAFKRENEAEMKRVEEARADFELEKAKVKGIQDQKQIRLDVGGVYYTTSISTLTREPQSMLGAMFSGRHELKFNDEGRYFIDRNGEYFGYVLEYLRDGLLTIPPEKDNEFFRGRLAREADFYGMKGFLQLLSCQEMDRLRDPKTALACTRVINTHSRVVECLQVSGNSIVSGSGDNSIHISDLSTGMCLGVLWHEASVLCLQVTGNIIVSGSQDNIVRVWDMLTLRNLATMRGHTGPVTCLQIVNGKVFSGSQDRSIKMWDINSKECTKTLNSHTDGILTMQASGNTLVTGGLDKTVRVWDIEKAKCVRVLLGHTAPVLWLQLVGEYNFFRLLLLLRFLFSTFEYFRLFICFRQTLISGSHDKSMIVWDITTGVSKRTLKGHVGGIGAFHAVGTAILSGSGDETMALWDITTGECERVFSVNGSVVCLQVVGNSVVAGFGDNSIQIWEW